jgi:hypothetical protein
MMEYLAVDQCSCQENKKCQIKFKLHPFEGTGQLPRQAEDNGIASLSAGRK